MNGANFVDEFISVESLDFYLTVVNVAAKKIIPCDNSCEKQSVD